VPERIQKVLANAGIGSRRSIERWVAEGRITVNGRIAKLGEQLQGRERICLDGKPVRVNAAVLARPRHAFLAYYKAGATRGAASDIFDLPRPRHGRWIEVSPLDRNTSGLVVLTTDGEIAAKLMHPSTVVEREYAVRLLGEPSESQIAQLEEGIQLDDGLARIAGIERGAGGGGGSNAWYHVTLREMRHRDLRPVLAAVGLAVSRVIRVRYDTVALGELYRGASRPLTPAESRALYALAGLERRRGPERRTAEG
jgi:23S rRNA pseudouridine2605 synthase